MADYLISQATDDVVPSMRSAVLVSLSYNNAHMVGWKWTSRSRPSVLENSICWLVILLASRWCARRIISSCETSFLVGNNVLVFN